LISAQPAYVGIDVAIAKSKRLPIVVSRHVNGRLEPLRLREYQAALPPVGPGNASVIDRHQSAMYAQDAAAYLRRIEFDFRLKIECIAIDAPGRYCREGDALRACEAALQEAEVPFFSTPTRREFDRILDDARRHRDGGGHAARFPYANKLWMSAGFALFDTLNEQWECLETYPHAVIRELGLTIKKSKQGGHEGHLQAALSHTGWRPDSLGRDLLAIAFGDPHDRVDAYLACWVASLPLEHRSSHGPRTSEGIWIPAIRNQLRP
jgi:hypothetical protein